MPACAEIQAKIVKDQADCDANHVFPVLCEQVDTAIEDPFATGLIHNNKRVCRDLKAVVVKARVDTLSYKQACVVIRQATG